jgi:hypothetical protein
MTDGKEINRRELKYTGTREGGCGSKKTLLQIYRIRIQAFGWIGTELDPKKGFWWLKF